MTEPQKIIDVSSLSRIDDVKNSTWILIKSTYKKQAILFGIFALIGLFTFPVITVVIFLICFMYFQSKVHNEFMRQFALANNLEYAKSIEMNSLRGRLMESGGSRSAHNCISGTYKDHLIRLFNYQFSVGGGKNSSTYSFTVMETTFEKTTFPYILLQSRIMYRYGNSDIIGKNNDAKIKLENDFEDSFSLFATNGYEVEALQIFTREMLQFLKDNGSKFSIEFAENRMYIYTNRYILKRSELAEMYQIAQKIFDQIGPLLNRLHDDFSALHPYYKDNKN
jgi:hypothetical protein